MHLDSVVIPLSIMSSMCMGTGIENEKEEFELFYFTINHRYHL